MIKREHENGVGVVMMMINLEEKQEGEKNTRSLKCFSSLNFSFFLKMKKKEYVDTHTHKHTCLLLSFCCHLSFLLRGSGVKD